ncbi:hypothetical protein [Roseibium aggregatum]|uniref:Uncharacterized protein n=1 Tax=Roseibium aggregatum TaxID=187304 RepID=A0A926P4E7_9HYPH|nr:hypothetical protein [Roseibium aggregatum]MBD1546722.1 hypothetical protein [Roseibium aggregatum]
MFDVLAQAYMTAARFSPYTRPQPSSEQKLAKRPRTSSTEERTEYRPRFWV